MEKEREKERDRERERGGGEGRINLLSGVLLRFYFYKPGALLVSLIA